jgi:hypothetical protein
VEDGEALRKACDGRGDAAGGGRSFRRRVVGGGAPTDVATVAELPELFQLKCPSPALEARPHLNGNNPSIPRI